MTRALADAVAVTPSQRLVLVVDDSSDMRGLLRDVLTEQGYEVVTAGSGGSALGMMAERLPDLVISDLFMPGMNGFTLRGEMLRRPELARVPVIVLSAFWQRPSETLDVVDVLPKPLNVDTLLAVVRRTLAPGEEAPVADASRPTAVPPGRGTQHTERRRDARRIQQEA